VAVKHRALCWFVGLVIAFGAARAGAAGDPRELKAREDFAAGRYQEALDVFAKLYAETLHPVYLRNIGRCYQNLGDADKAIISFRDYLRKHKTISADERAEVEGFIKEMEALKKEKASETPTPETSPPPKSTITTLPTAPEPKDSAGGKRPEVLVTAPRGGAHEESSPVYTTWWFWTLVGAALVGAGVGIAAATGVFTKTKDAPCMTGYTCPGS
jgi:hypothetical protein